KLYSCLGSVVKVVGSRSDFRRFRWAVSLDRFTNISCLPRIVNPFWEKIFRSGQIPCQQSLLGVYLVADSESQSVTPMPQKPALVKTAELWLRVESIDQTMVQLRQILRHKQGDVYDLQDKRPQDSNRHRQTTLTLKVPSIVLEYRSGKLGKIQLTPPEV
ncbi:hypothetical protein, partial [Chamaesiphon sp. OTE_8_metabat_110]|uniref:hypothetical protein n=1 Tax=Chamaesiphon sp. OTE_8_metabat_110 TaxID=2964696 RepID=UPI00286AB581